jgi:hypothetical protein
VNASKDLNRIRLYKPVSTTLKSWEMEAVISLIGLAFAIRVIWTTIQDSAEMDREREPDDSSSLGRRLATERCEQLCKPKPPILIPYSEFINEEQVFMY